MSGMSTEIDLLTMLLLGLTGTGHCLGMCGPLVAAIPGKTGKWSAHLAYHAGRLITYTVIGAGLGAVSGHLGHMAAAVQQDPRQNPLIWVARLQILVSMGAALLLLILGLHRLGFCQGSHRLAARITDNLPGIGRAISRNRRRQGSFGPVFVLGLILGMLPCGLSYAAFARTLASGGWFSGARMTLAFGLGTLPGLLFLGTSAGAVWQRHRQASEILSGLIMVGMSLMLTVRIWNGAG